MASVSLSTCESVTVVEADGGGPLCDGSVDMNLFVLALFSGSSGRMTLRVLV